MDNQQNEITFLSDFLRTFGIIFNMSIIAISVIGVILSRFVPESRGILTLFTSDGRGLPFTAILEVAVFTIVISLIKVFLFSEYLFIKMRFLWRSFLLLLMTLLTFSVFAVFFNWFTVNDPKAWIGFVISTVICFSIGMCLTILKLKIEGKRFDKLLTNYKARRKSMGEQNN